MRVPESAAWSFQLHGMLILSFVSLQCLNIMQGTIWMMSSQLLADPHGKIIPHLEQHNLESVFWTIFWCLVKCQGPFHDIVRWFAKISQSQTTSVVFDGTDSTTMELLPPYWMRAGLYHYTFRNVLESRLQTLSNWEYYKSLIQPYWHDTVILTGMEKMFNIFMSKGIAQAKSGGGIKFNLAFNQGLGNDQLIGIIEEILAGMGNNVNYLYMTSQLMVDVKNNGWQRYEALLWHSQLPPVHDPNDNLANNPTTTIPPECHCPLPSIDSSDVSYSAPSLQGSESVYSVISSCGQQQLYSFFTTGHHDKWAGLTMAAAKDMLKHNIRIHHGGVDLFSRASTRTSYHRFSKMDVNIFTTAMEKRVEVDRGISMLNPCQLPCSRSHGCMFF